MLKGADFIGAELKGANLGAADLERARLAAVDLSEALLSKANLRHARAQGANLRGAFALEADAANADLSDADIRNAQLVGASLLGTTATNATADRFTSFWWCSVDKGTDLRGTAFGIAKVDPATRQLLEHNTRRLNWEDWYKKHRFLKRLARPFWAVSDYGRSTSRVIAVFFVLATVFALIYWIWGLVARPGVVDRLFLHENALANFARAFYFSIVTMTTLGFGDMYAARSIPAYFLLTIQVLLGYALLAALVTRLAILFTSDGPAGKFAKAEKKAKRPLR
jgi:hypothetical protein